MIASLTFHEVLVQWVSLFISSPFLFLCDCLRLPTSHLRTHLCHWRNSHEQENGSASPKQKQHLLRVELHGPFLGAVGLSMPCPPQMVYPKVSCCKASGIALAEQWLSRTSSCVSWINLAKLLRVLQKRSTRFYIWIALAFFLSYCLLNPVAQTVVLNRTPVHAVFWIATEAKGMFNKILLFWDSRCWKQNVQGIKGNSSVHFFQWLDVKPWNQTWTIFW